ncbi:hypothetical protein [Mucilaginibacter phyllosphaerae]
METNIKLVTSGMELKIRVCEYQLIGQSLSKQEAQRLCAILSRENIPSVPYLKDGKWNTILALANSNIPRKSFTVDDWIIKIEPTNQEMTLSLNKQFRQLAGDLYKRALLMQINKNTKMWTLDSPRIFYEKDPFLKNDFMNKYKNVTDVEGYRRFEVSDIFVDGAGLGFSINVSTAFFTSLTVEDYFKGGHYSNIFQKLAGRQSEQKGTLMYDGPNGRSKCYFEKYCPDVTVATTPALVVKNRTYNNLYEYYQETAPDYLVKPTDKTAMVSFPGLTKKSFVPANKLYLRVMNDVLDYNMSKRDKIDPQERGKLLNRFWGALSSNPFGRYLNGVEKGYYTPDETKCGRFDLPPLLFGNNFKQMPPIVAIQENYKKHFNDRRSNLERFGCYFTPRSYAREIYFVYPEHVGEPLSELYAADICAKIEKLTGMSLDPVIRLYSNYEDLIDDLKYDHDPAMVVFAFDDNDSATYFHIRHHLKDWQLKRLTSHQLKRNYRNYMDYKDGKKLNNKAERDWRSYIEQCAYDIIQQLGCLPYVVEPTLAYDMQLIIDVSEKSSHIALSLFMYKEGMKFPESDSLIKTKTDRKKEEISKVFLEKYLKELLLANKEVIKKYKMNSLLVLRDGKDCGEEFEAIKSTIAFFQEKGLFGNDFKFDFVEYHKSSLKEVRIWEKSAGMNVNPLEGSYLLLDEETAIITTTGSGTLNQGTATPIMVKSKYTNCDLLPILRDIFITSQPNYSSPRVAQRLTYSAKRADEQLKDRVAQEVYRIN